MELKEFIKNVLADIVESVDEISGQSKRKISLSYRPETRTIEFDVAVTVTNESKSGVAGAAKAGISVLGFDLLGGELEGNQNMASTSSKVSRIKFGVDVDQKTKEEIQEEEREMQRLASGFPHASNY